MLSKCTHLSLVSWLVLHLAPGFHAAAWREVLGSGRRPSELCALGLADLMAMGLSNETARAIVCPDQAAIERILCWGESLGHWVLTREDPSYPERLRHIPDPPPVLYVRGDASVLQRPQIAIVGSRNPTHVGRELAFQFAQSLAQAGLVVTSGLASGVDGAAHRGAIQSGGSSVAVLGSGVKMIYPKQHEGLAESLVDTGALVSEFPLHAPPKRHQFPQRNRLISGLSLGTLVVEAAPKSGSLITARLAAEQGREVFALPGSLVNPVAAGCLSLIQDGAKLVTCVEDILDELDFNATPTLGSRTVKGPVDLPALEKDEKKVLGYLSHEVSAIESVVERSGLLVSRVLALLCSLELKGYVVKERGGYAVVFQLPPETLIEG